MPITVTKPEAFFGFKLGSDRKIARWDRIVAYFEQLATESDRIRVANLGPSTEGNPFLLTIISSPANLSRLDHYRKVNLKLSDPRGLSREDIQPLVDEGKVIICQSMSLHATEIGGTQMAPELAYDLLSSDCEDTLRILDNVIFLMVPCFNPDGQIMVTDWYDQWVGTEYEGSQYPRLYQKYTGHDNNRDALTMNMVEARYMGHILFREWKPQAYLDHHHQGSEAARYNIPPYSDPIHPYGDPLVWREINWFGGHMAYCLEQAGKQGVLHAARYEGWGHLGFHWITIYHNIAGMLTESASAKLATPLYIHPHQLKGASPKTMPVYEAQTNFPNPWPGGWWRLRDIVEQQKISAWALLDIAARCRSMVLWNTYHKAINQTARGEASEVKSYIIPATQHDTLTANKLVQALLNQGLDLMVAGEEFTVGGANYEAGSYVVPLAQPKGGLAPTLLGRTHFPDGYWTRTDDGTPMVRDMATDTLAEFMGIRVVPCSEPIMVALTKVDALPCFAAEPVPNATAGLLLDPRHNDNHTVVNRLLALGVPVWRLPAETVNVCGDLLPPGAFYIETGAATPAVLAEATAGLHVGYTALGVAPCCKREVAPKRVAMYQRYWAGNMDEGWTRWVLERFEFPYTTVMDADILAGNLKDRFDVLILPSDNKEMMLGPIEHGGRDPRIAATLQRFGNCPPEFRSGFGTQGVSAIREFVAAGGRLVAMDAASKLAIEACGLNVRNVVEGLSSKAYMTKGSTLRTLIDANDPLAYGMPNEAWVISWDSPVFEITDTFSSERYTTVAAFPQRDILQSGWLIGEQHLAGRSALVRAETGCGEVILIGFRCQNRGQAHGTFKLLFNCLR